MNIFQIFKFQTWSMLVDWMHSSMMAYVVLSNTHSQETSAHSFLTDQFIWLLGLTWAPSAFKITTISLTVSNVSLTSIDHASSGSQQISMHAQLKGFVIFQIERYLSLEGCKLSRPQIMIFLSRCKRTPLNRFQLTSFFTPDISSFTNPKRCGCFWTLQK